MNRHVILALLLILVACAVPEPTTTPDRAPSLAPSLTVLPILPSEPADLSIGRSDPTSASLAGEDEPSLEPTGELIIPTVPSVPLQIIADDGTLISMRFYGAAVRPAPSLLLLHDTGQDGDIWGFSASQLQAAGYNVFVPDLRDRRLSAETIDWALVTMDVIQMVENINMLSGVTTNRMMMIGMGTGANLALISCDEVIDCIGAVAINPQAIPDVNSYSNRSLLVISTDNDTIGTAKAEQFSTSFGGDVNWQRYSEGGQEIILGQNDLIPHIIEWVQGRL